MVEVIWTPGAISDIEGISQYISKDSPARADAFTDRIFDNEGIISQFPASGRIVPEIGDPSIREHFEQRYRILYWMRDDGTAWVLAVWHGHRVLPKKVVSRRKKTP